MNKNTKSVSIVDAISKILDECLHLVFKRNELGVVFPFNTILLVDYFLADVNEKVSATNVQMKNKIDADKLVSFFNPKNSRENIQRKFYEEVDNELLDMINSRLDLYNKLSGGKANERVKELLFEQLYEKLMAINRIAMYAS